MGIQNLVTSVLLSKNIHKFFALGTRMMAQWLALVLTEDPDSIPNTNMATPRGSHTEIHAAKSPMYINKNKLKKIT